MKMLLVALLILLSSFVEVRGFSIPGEPEIPMGSEAVVEKYCLTNGLGLAVYVMQNSTNGRRVTYYKLNYNSKFYSKEDLDSATRTLAFQTISNFISLAPYGQDKDRPFILHAVYTRISGMDTYFNHLNENMVLIKTNGTYKVPDLSGVVMQLPDLIPYRLNLITWARIETLNTLSGTTFFDDSVFGSPYIQTTIVTPGFCLTIPREDAINAGGTVNIKINVWNGGKFEVYQDGKIVPEDQPKLSFTLPVPSSSRRALKVPVYTPAPLPTPTLNVIGGEIGRTYSINKSTNGPSGPWVDTGNLYRVTPYSNSTNLFFEMTGNTFIRLQSTNTPPVY